MASEHIYTLQEATSLVEKADNRLQDARLTLAQRREETNTALPDNGHYIFESIPQAISALTGIVNEYDDVQKSLAVPGHVATVQESRQLTALADRMGF